MEEKLQQSQINQPDSTQVPVAVPEKKSNTLLIVILLIAILLIGVGGVYGGMQIGKKQTLPTSIPTQVVQPTSVVVLPTNTPNETANWKIYRNEKYTLKYPFDWEEIKSIGQIPVERKYDSGFVSKNGSISIGILVNLPGFGEECFSETTEKVGIELLSKKDQYSIYRGTKNDLCDNTDDLKVFLGNQNNVDHYLFMLNFKVKNKEESVKLFDQILSSFKFLE